MSTEATHRGSDTRVGRSAAIAALGIVFGDIGTSPLYALREAFGGHGHSVAVVEANVLGALSIIAWSLIVIICVKYLTFVMRADNNGEGGILALVALLRRSSAQASRRRRCLLLLGLFGTALLYGDAAITPAISVLSAVEGIAVATPALSPAVIPIAVAILVALFAVQRRGTSAIAKVFGPVMLVWFVVLAVLGARELVSEPEVLRALHPGYGFTFLRDNPFDGFRSLGALFLVVTGGEALYADMGHFGRRPIRQAWYAVVFPALLLSYFGQGALLIGDPEAVDAPLYRMVPEWGIYPMVALATAAAVIASQALISGVFSLTMQAIQLGYAPRHRIRHTSEHTFGQVYIGVINWALLAACVALVIGFGSSTRLASAYGLAVTSTMVITTVLLYAFVRERLRWSKAAALTLCGGIAVFDVAYFGANLFKLVSGGWVPLLGALVMFGLMTTWSTGRAIVAARVGRNRISLRAYVDSLQHSRHRLLRVEGTAIYLFSTPGLTPPALIANVRHNNVLHEQVIVVAVRVELQPRLPPSRRSEVEDLGGGIVGVVLHYGFMEQPDVPAGLRQGPISQLNVEPALAVFILGAESIRVTPRPGMARWREHLFAFLSRNATSPVTYFNLPSDRTITLSRPIEV